MRFVLDTNILISGLITPTGTKPPALLIDAVRQEKLTLITSTVQMDEFVDVVGRPHLQNYLKPGVVEDFVRFMEGAAVVVRDPLPEATESPDQDDNLILATARAGNADLIVSGDKRHVLSLGRFRGIEIVTAAQAVARLFPP